MISKLISDGQTGEERVRVAALRHLGSGIEVTSVQNNANAPTDYGDPVVEECWRVYFELQLVVQAHVGGDSPYILIEKETHRVIGRGIERGE